MSIEFGILRPGSTITLVGEQRVTLDEACFEEFQPAFSRVESLTGTEIDMYSSARFSGDNLRIFITELEELQTPRQTRPLSADATACLADLLRVARAAMETRQELTYFGE